MPGHRVLWPLPLAGDFNPRNSRTRRAPSSLLPRLHLALALLWLAERGWKWWRVRQFFHQPIPAPDHEPAQTLVSIIQPILSGDPTLDDSLAATLRARSSYPREWLWLVDEDDAEGLRVCRDLIAHHPDRAIALIPTPPPAPDDWRNPKTIKLIAGAAVARGRILCVLDDDTRLPDDGLERCLPFLDRPGVGLAYGLPYYVSFADLWSSLVAAFVNASSLLTYIPPLALTAPFTINGMFYAVRREALAAVGGFSGLEATLADDFAVAQRFRHAGYSLAQTPLRHAISTHVAGPRHYTALIARWFVFPRESVLRHVAPRDRAIGQRPDRRPHGPAARPPPRHPRPSQPPRRRPPRPLPRRQLRRLRPHRSRLPRRRDPALARPARPSSPDPPPPPGRRRPPPPPANRVARPHHGSRARRWLPPHSPP